MSNFSKTVLSIHAHPDDTEAFCAGTLALLKEKGFKIVIATMTPGGMGGVSHGEEDTAKIRIKEAEAAAEVLGAEYYCLDQRDGYVFDTLDARVKVTELVRKVDAGVVFTHLPFDYHSDHRATCSIVEAGTMLASLENVPTKIPPIDKIPLVYHTETFGFTDTLGRKIPDPSFFVDITDTWDIKIQMLSKHDSQRELMRHMFDIEDFFKDTREADEHVGGMAGVKYAEAYWQHLGAGFSKEPLIQDILKDFTRSRIDE